MRKDTSILSAAVIALLVSGGYFSFHQQQQISNLSSELMSARDNLSKSAEKFGTELNELSEKLAIAESRHVNDVNRLDASLGSLKSPPSVEQVANSIFATQREELASSVEAALSTDSKFLSAVRGPPGKDADPSLVAKEIAPDEEFIDSVADRIWATKRSDLISNQELIATIAAKVQSQYGAELNGADRVTGLAKTIAKELAMEPAFANLVASMSH